MPDTTNPRVVVLVAADAEWRAVKAQHPMERFQDSPFGEWFQTWIHLAQEDRIPVVFFQGGWGKIAAAASTQYVIDCWKPELLVNLGTCGGFAGEIAKGEIVLVEKAIVYDILERMGDPAAHLAHYTTHIDLSWLGDKLPHPVVRGMMLSADRDLEPADIPQLKYRFQARAGDWETAAIAWVAQRNQQRCLVLRGVSDLVGENGSPAYTNNDYFEQSAWVLMKQLVSMLPDWISLALKR
jgi:adenosylhomocysteine nucleosidase